MGSSASLMGGGGGAMTGGSSGGGGGDGDAGIFQYPQYPPAPPEEESPEEENPESPSEVSSIPTASYTLRGDRGATIRLLDRLFRSMYVKAAMGGFEDGPTFGVRNHDGLFVAVIEPCDMDMYTALLKDSSPAGEVNDPESLAIHVQWLLSVVPEALTL
eukprot:2303852-Alexandrium_andersonii.AAC.1